MSEIKYSKSEIDFSNMPRHYQNNAQIYHKLGNTYTQKLNDNRAFTNRPSNQNDDDDL